MRDGWPGLVELAVFEMRAVATALDEGSITRDGAAKLLRDSASQAETLLTIHDIPLDKSKFPSLLDYLNHRQEN